jgi:integrase
MKKKSENEILFEKEVINAIKWKARRNQSGQAIEDWYIDQDQNNHYLRVNEFSKSFYFIKKRNGRKYKIRIGDVDVYSVKASRKRCTEYSFKVDEGEDPTFDKDSNEITLFILYKEMLAEKTRKANTLRDYAKCIDSYFYDWANKPWASITKENVITRFKKLAEKHGDAQANQAMRFLNAIGNYAIDVYEEIFLKNPVSVITKRKMWKEIKPREIFIEEKYLLPFLIEIRKRKSLVGRSYVEFVLLTGLRKEEAATLTWDRIDLDQEVMIFDDTKNKEDKYIPISNRTKQILLDLKAISPPNNPYVFPSKDKHGNPSHYTNPDRIMEIVTKKIGIECSTHDLRRTFATHMDTIGCPQSSTKVLMGQKVTDVLNKHYVRKNRVVLKLWLEKYYDFLTMTKKVVSIDDYQRRAAV